MKNLLFLVAITFTMLFTACSKNDESKLTDEEKALAHQEEMYQAMKKDIVGHWKGAQQFDEKWSSRNTSPVVTGIASFRLVYETIVLLR